MIVTAWIIDVDLRGPLAGVRVRVDAGRLMALEAAPGSSLASMIRNVNAISDCVLSGPTREQIYAMQTPVLEVFASQINQAVRADARRRLQEHNQAK